MKIKSKKPSYIDLDHYRYVYDEFIFNDLKNQIEIYKEQMSSIPLISMILHWLNIDPYYKNQFRDEIDNLYDLIHKGFIEWKDEKNNLITIKHFSSICNTFIIDSIRCKKEWSITEQEEYVRFYKDFSKWLSEKTFGYILESKDRDRINTKDRQISFDKYLKIIDHLKLRERILVKIFYLGGSIGLEEVMSIMIKDINFKHKYIEIDNYEIFYSPHVFLDIKELIGERSLGYLFSGKNTERINHSVCYRALKAIIKKLGMPQNITFKSFTRNI